MSRRIINIVNFIRGVEPRLPMDLHAPVAWQMEQARIYDLPTTWLLQYDALLDDFYVDILRKRPESHECGLWFEVPQPLCEACGIPWRGRYPWDWHTNVGFSLGYTPEQREKLADELVEMFRKKLGEPPRTMGSWIFDAHLLSYLHRKHGIIGACNCKDQWGTDGYTLWGGYWANGYYPSTQNAYLPAQTQEFQIPVPVFRMLGSDPIYQYDADPNTENGQPVITLEPVYTTFNCKAGGGGHPAWVDWFFRNEFAEPVLNLAYAQAGQENSFGLPRIRHGMSYQYPYIAQLRKEGKIEVETLSSTSQWFRRTFERTPATAVTALEDWQEKGQASIWYMTASGRINLFQESDGELVIRDWQLFSQYLNEPYLTKSCPTNDTIYYALPLCDGGRWGARIRFYGNCLPVKGMFAQPQKTGEQSLECSSEDQCLSFHLDETTLVIHHGFAQLKMALECRMPHPEIKLDNHAVYLELEQIRYGIRLPEGVIVELTPVGFTLTTAAAELTLTTFTIPNGAMK